MKAGYLYILASSKNGILYVGVTSNLIKRIYQHKEKLIEGFTEKHNISRLVYYEQFNNIETAIIREKNIKHWKRSWKVRTIEQFNPEWKDLYKNII